MLASTTTQSNSTTWQEMRVGRITASRVHSVLHTNAENPAPSVVKSICTPSSDLSHVPAIQWGRDNESAAIRRYKEEHLAHHPDLQVTPSGLWLSEEHSFIGASPDGLLECSSCGKGVLEVKCPYKFKNFHDLELVIADKSVCLERDTAGHITLKRSNEYYSQLQCQMYVCDRQYGDFALWTPNIFITCRVERDDEFIANMVDVVPVFWKKHCLPELLTRSLEQQSAKVTPSEEPEFSYCICKTDLGGMMIGCDNPECKTKWYHMSCIKRIRPPKGHWFCKDCKK